MEKLQEKIRKINAERDRQLTLARLAGEEQARILAKQEQEQAKRKRKRFLAMLFAKQAKKAKKQFQPFAQWSFDFLSEYFEILHNYGKYADMAKKKYNYYTSLDEFKVEIIRFCKGLNNGKFYTSSFEQWLKQYKFYTLKAGITQKEKLKKYRNSYFTISKALFYTYLIEKHSEYAIKFVYYLSMRYMNKHYVGAWQWQDLEEHAMQSCLEFAKGKRLGYTPQKNGHCPVFYVLPTLEKEQELENGKKRKYLDVDTYFENFQYTKLAKLQKLGDNTYAPIMDSTVDYDLSYKQGAMIVSCVDMEEKKQQRLEQWLETYNGIDLSYVGKINLYTICSWIDSYFHIQQEKRLIKVSKEKWYKKIYQLLYDAIQGLFSYQKSMLLLNVLKENNIDLEESKALFQDFSAYPITKGITVI